MMPLLLLPLAACGAGERDVVEPTAPATETVTATTTATETATATETTTSATTIEPADTPAAQSLYTTGEMSTQPSGPAELVIQDVRAGSHDGFDRVVFEFSGTGTPWFHAGYTSQPRQQASGYPLDVPGSAFLEISIHGTPMMLESQREDLLGVGPVGVGAGSVVGVVHGGVFEADTQYVIGLDRQRPYQVYTLESPTRVVVEFQQ